MKRSNGRGGRTCGAFGSAEPRAGRLRAAPLAAALLLGACTETAAYSVYVENDAFGAGNRDRYYTNGMRLSGMYSRNELPERVVTAAETVPDVVTTTTSQVGWVLGQDMYTPDDLERDPPDPADRPYAGWLYAGVLLAKAERASDGPAGDNVDVWELDLGVVGPASGADRLQTQFHDLVDSQRGEGWDHQLRNEPGLVLQYEHRRRLLHADLDGFGEFDLLGAAGANLGNVFTHGMAATTLRWGGNVRRDFGPNTAHTTAVDVPDVKIHEGFRWYLFAAAEGKAVARNVFLDGNTWRDSPDVDSRTWVGELRGGLALEWGSFRLQYANIRRSREFEGQDDAQSYGSLALTWTTNF